MTNATTDPFADVPPPPEPPSSGARRLTVRALADVTTPDVERVTSAKAVPLFAAMLSAIVGPSETGKTTLAAAAVLDVAAAGGVVLVFDGEMSAPSWRRKLVQLGATDEQLELVLYAEMSTDSAEVNTVRAEVQRRRIRLVVWDSALSLISRTCRSQNDNSEVGRLMDRLRDIVRDGPAGLIVDHSSKGSDSPVSRGASAKFAALDLSYGVRLAEGCIPGPLEPWSTIVSVEKDRHALLGSRGDREATFIPLGYGNLNVEVVELSGSSHRLSSNNPQAVIVSKIAALDPAPVSANNAYKRIGGTRTAVLAAYRQWCGESCSGGSSHVVANHRTTGANQFEPPEPPPGASSSVAAARGAV